MISGSGTWNPFRARLVNAIVNRQLRTRLEAVYVDGRAFDIDPEAVDIWIGNHTSRWDGFLIWKLKHLLNPSGRLFTIMLDEQLGQHRIFRGAGAVGIEPGSTTSIRSLVRFLSEDVEAGDSIVAFPQGQIYAGDRDPLGFKSLARIGVHLRHPSRLVACGLAVEMLAGRKPTAFMRFANPVSTDAERALEQASDRVAREVAILRDRLSRHGEHLPGNWPGYHLN